MDNTKTTFYIVRHGQTEWNSKRIIQGHKDSPLTELGINQAKDLAEKLKHVQFDEIFSSDLLRAQKTAEIFNAERKLHIQTAELLREKHYGKFEGTSLDDFLKAFGEWESLSKEKQLNHPLYGQVEDSELAAARFITFLREIALGFPGKTVLIVSHGIIMRNFLVHLGYIKQEEVMFISNSGYIHVESDGIEFFVKEVAGLEKSRHATK